MRLGGKIVTVTSLPQSRPLKRADLNAMPDDGHRYELIDGLLVVSPTPSWRHQQVVGELFTLLREASPPDCRVFVAPVDVVLADDTVIQPDLVVARLADLSENDLPAPPLLAVEVLSPSTRRVDLMLKHSRLEAAGCRSYWVIDPEHRELIVWQLQAGTYVETARVRDDQQYAAQEPFDVTVRPSKLFID